MLVNNKTRYAISAMIDIAQNSHNDIPVSLKKIAERQSISLGYLEQIFVLLKRANIVTASKGPSGGYVLVKTPNLIPLLEIINATKENIEMTKCKGRKNCDNYHKCLTHDIWQDLSSHIMLYFKEISLMDVMC